ncbi:unnamed protein product [Lactuca saligna]|uniref:non-specific serine/threonine protein kinase n=1 Tax=Lactuca saligna TaxID=75948 RepID=A0AA35V9H5_LACSI|nr:unnamed protein product [Lactuca saligna]
MNPRYHILKLLILIIIQECSSNSAGFYGTCNTSFSCGTISGFQYPFRRHQDPTYCGYPGFELNCDHQNPAIIKIMNITYKVLGIDPTAQILKIVREDMINSMCPQELVNTTIDPKLFDYTKSYMNISILFGCPLSFNFMGIGSIFCANDELNPVFLVPGIQGPGNCETSVVIPFPVEFLKSDVLGRVFQKGFDVIWKVEGSGCRECIQSGGQCIYDDNTVLTMCACPESPFLADSCSTVNKTDVNASPFVSTSTSSGMQLYTFVTLNDSFDLHAMFYMSFCMWYLVFLATYGKRISESLNYYIMIIRAIGKRTG